MKTLILSILALSFLNTASAQTIENAPGASDPAKLKVVASQYGGALYTYEKTTNQDGSIQYSRLNKVLALEVTTHQSGPDTYAYQIFSKSGTILSSQKISQNVYLRLNSIMKQSAKNFDGDYGYGTFDTDTCFISIEIDRATLTLEKVTPSCDDLM